MLRNIIPELIIGLLSLPAILISLSVHEASHGLMAYKLGDPTAKNLGRLTLNPIKHINPIGFICMFLFRIGWANPVPISTRNFKKPRRDMALTAAAGPLSNLLLAIVFALLLRLVMIPLAGYEEQMLSTYFAGTTGLYNDVMFWLLAILAVMLYYGIILNISLMLFNLIPLPPLDGSRIAYIFLPSKWYFGIMKYERYIMIAFLVLLYFGVLTLPIGILSNYIEEGLFKLTAMPTMLNGDIYLFDLVQALLFSRFGF